MKKLLIFSFFSLCLSFSSIAQTKFGVGGTYVNDIGVQARASLGLSDGIGVIPSFSYYFTDLVTVWSIDANLTYNVATIGDDLPIYALGGLDYTTSSFSGTSNSEIGINLGGGLDITSNIYAELFYRRFFCDGCGGDLGVNAGYYF